MLQSELFNISQRLNFLDGGFMQELSLDTSAQIAL